MDRGNYYSGCQARDSSAEEGNLSACGITPLWKDRILVCGGENMPGKDRILLCGGRTHQGKTRSCYVVEMSRRLALTYTGCPWGPEGTAYRNIQVVSLKQTWQPVLTGAGCPCGPGGTAEILSITLTIGVTPSSMIKGGNPTMAVNQS